MLNLTAKVIGVPLQKLAGEAAGNAVVKTIQKEGSEAINVTVNDAFQRYGKANAAGIVNGGKFIGVKGRLQLFTLRMKAIGKIVGELIGKLRDKLPAKLGGGGKLTAEEAGAKAKAQAEQAQASAT